MLRHHIPRRLFLYLFLLTAYADSAEKSWIFQDDPPVLAATPLSFAEDGWRILPGGETQARKIPRELFRGWLRIRPDAERTFQNVRVRFRNGDHLDGHLLHLNGDTLRLRTAWEEEVDLRMHAIDALQMSRHPKELVLHGTRNLDDWQHPNRLSEDKAVEAQPTAGGLLIHQPLPGLMRRPLPPLPDQMLLELTLQLPAADTPYSVYLFSNERTVYNPGTVHLGFRDGKLLIQQRTYQNVAVEFDMALPENLGDRHAFEIYVNHPAKRFEIWLNGHRIHELALVLGENPKEGGLWFSVLTKPGDAYFLENLRVYSWNGNSPMLPPPQVEEENLWKITLANSDHLAASMLKIQDETFTLSLEGRPPMTLPLRVLRAIQFPRVSREADEPGEVLLRLASGMGRLSGSLTALDHENVHFQSPFGSAPLTIPLAEVDGIWRGGHPLPAFPVQPKTDP
ncbi:MAG: hypothetical protein JJU29_00080 [Verrucomicrobia bacterium]|nr:hypothetical protein [Verrucomicrobiota bacterium]MCH8511045.1 hypothetical protein [Kiritimatiellia bacterium]